ncbi:MAG: molybdate ABC transporter permease subunit [Ardenticatenaceae bacterium]|nr:molybdate ABC transporter permease subunit [Ardenticatenaceae bacterium]MCB8974692.1 molybdate ABC transporter permease subunit [Ardenticatenaceae bacterium]
MKVGQKSESTGSARWVGWVTAVLATLMSLFLILPLVGLVWRALSLPGTAVLNQSSLASAILLSLSTTAVSVLLIILLGTPLAYVLARYPLRGKQLLTVFIELPIVMPPVVAGLGLLSVFGRRGLLGLPLAELGITITFSGTAVVLAQLFVASPFYIRAAQSRFAALPPEFEDAAAVDGANRWQIFRHIMLPLSRNGLLAGLILSWARALGEFGATILFAGNLQGTTQTMPLLVYASLERDLRITFITALILLGLAVVAFGVTRWLTGLDAHER